MGFFFNWFKRGEPVSSLPAAAPLTTKHKGDRGEDLALAYLQRQGLRLLARNYRTPGRGGGEIDLILHAPDGTTVFVEVRARRSSSHGGGAASVTATKQRRIVLAARHYLMQFPTAPPCRFDVLVLDGQQMEWLQAAFTAD